MNTLSKRPEAPHLFIFGFGYSAAVLAQQLMAKGWQVSATSRHKPRRLEMQRLGVNAYDFNDDRIPAALAAATHLLSSVSPNRLGDPVLKHHGQAIAQAAPWQWVGYLSTTGVYGDHQGDWVDETTPPQPQNQRQQKRLQAERQWLNLAYEVPVNGEKQLPVHIFRLAGIYGPGRGVVWKLKRGMACRVFKEGQFFSRIHVRDIALALEASIELPQAGSVYNVCDDQPAPAHVVADFAAQKMGITSPPLVDWQQANLSEMAQEFYSANRRVRNDKIKALLPEGKWHYPCFQSGISADVEAMKEK